MFFFFQAEDGIRDLVRSRGLEMCIRDRADRLAMGVALLVHDIVRELLLHLLGERFDAHLVACLLYTSDAADERSSVDLGGRRIIKKKQE